MKWQLGNGAMNLISEMKCTSIFYYVRFIFLFYIIKWKCTEINTEFWFIFLSYGKLKKCPIKNVYCYQI